MNFAKFLVLALVLLATVQSVDGQRARRRRYVPRRRRRYVRRPRRPPTKPQLGTHYIRTSSTDHRYHGNDRLALGNFPVAGQGVFTFKCIVQSDLHLALLTAEANGLPNYRDPRNMYEIVIGGHDNTQSVIRKGLGTKNLVVEKGHLTGDRRIQSFWVVVGAGFIRVGKGMTPSERTQFMVYQNKNILPVKYAAFSTGMGKPGRFGVFKWGGLTAKVQRQLHTEAKDELVPISMRHAQGKTTHRYRFTTEIPRLHYVIILVPNCEEVQVDHTEPRSVMLRHRYRRIQGLAFEVPAGVQSAELEITYKGLIASGPSEFYSICHEMRTQFHVPVEGAICEHVEVTTCKAGKAQKASCTGSRTRFTLDASASENVKSFSWSSSSSNVVIRGGDTAFPSVEVLPPTCNEAHTLTLTVTDAQGKDQQCTTSVTVTDDKAPEIHGLYIEDGIVECDDVPYAAKPSVADNCDPEAAVSMAEHKTPLNTTSTELYMLTRTWTAQDACGNEMSRSQTMKVVDTTKPTIIGVREDTTVECNAIPDPCTVSAVDNCKEMPDIVYEQNVVSQACEGNYTLQRTWTATDASGNKEVKTQYITVQDTHAPLIVGAPAGEIQASCDGIPPAANVSAFDNCDEGEVDVRFEENKISGANKANFVIERSWTATDSCGHTSSISQQVIVTDDQPPSLVGLQGGVHASPVAVPKGCDVTAADNCDPEPRVTNEQRRIDGRCPNNFFIERTFRATDASGNTASEVVTIEVDDTVAPHFAGLPAQDMTVECDDLPIFAVSAVDEVDGEIVPTYTSKKINVESETHYTVLNTWEATDLCGNTATATQTVTVQDTRAPELIGLPREQVTATCKRQPPAPKVTVRDNCESECETPIKVKFEEKRVDGDCVNTFQILRTWSATDCGGLTTEFTQTITVKDDEKPTFHHRPRDVTAECDAVPPAANVTATDNCDEVEVVYDETRVSGKSVDEYKLIRTWSTKDRCGNSDTHVQTVTVEDTEAPQLGDTPCTRYASCDDVPEAFAVVAFDNCDSNVEVMMEEEIIAGKCKDNYVVVHKWTATDNSGLTDTTSSKIIVSDTKDPEFTELPHNGELHVYMEAGSVKPAATLEATDNCRSEVPVVFEEEKIPLKNEQNYKLVRAWSAVDNCGNSVEHVIEVIVHDTTAPVLTITPADANVPCSDIPEAPKVEAEDVAEVSVEFSETIVERECKHGYKIVREWSAQDPSGNSVSHVQTLTVQDLEKPSLINVPTDEEIPCPELPEVANVLADDNCSEDDDLELHFAEEVVSESSINDKTVVRSWTAIDGCGNRVEAKQTIKMFDNVLPTFEHTPEDLEVDCHAVPQAPTVAVSDNCDYNIEVEYDETRYDGECAHDYVLERRWQANDVSGNSIEHIQRVSVKDDNRPKFATHPKESITVQCDNVPEPAKMEASDLCTDMSAQKIKFKETRISGKSLNDYQLKREWLTSDVCGNKEKFTQIVYVEDSTAPRMTAAPVDVTVQCDEVPEAPVLKASDNCDETVTVEYTQTMALTKGAESPNDYTLVRTWRAVDVSGNEVSRTQTITVEDTEAPVFEPRLPKNAVLEACKVREPETVAAVDNCDNYVEVVMTSEKVYNHKGTSHAVPGARRRLAAVETNEQEYYVVYRYSVTDSSGNAETMTHTQIYTDRTNPSFHNLPSRRIKAECDNVPEAYQGITVSDCDAEIDMELKEWIVPGSQDCDHGYTLRRRWTGVDDSKNTASFTQDIYVADTTAPELKGVPADVREECDSVTPHVKVTAEDNCDRRPKVVYQEQIHKQTENDYTIERTWTATDDCGVSSSGVQRVSVYDETAPILLGVPKDLTTSHHLLPKPAKVQATDNCDGNLKISFDQRKIKGDCAYRYTLVRTWTVADVSGNEVSASQTITVEDNTAPVFTKLPADRVDEVQNKSVAEVVGAHDSNPKTSTPTAVDYSVQKINEVNANEYHELRTWSTKDVCGNEASYTQTVQVIDTVPPTLVGVPSDIVVECDAVPNPADVTHEVDHATDESTIVTFTEEKTPGECDGKYVITRTWQATDAAGNTDTGVQVVTVVDTQYPTWGDLPAESVTYEADEVLDAPTLTAFDNCAVQTSDTGAEYGEVTVELEETREDGRNVNEYTLKRHYRVTDSCGHLEEFVQIATVTDTKPPVYQSRLPAAEIVECSGIPEPSKLSARDSTETTVTIDYGENQGDNNCENDFTIIRRWTATDLSGNPTEHVQMLDVRDTTPPQLFRLPKPVTVECDNVPKPIPGSATDACDKDVVVSMNEQRVNGKDENQYKLIRTYTATDNCGNEDVDSTTVTVVDTTAPQIVDGPEDETFECDEEREVHTVHAVDNCDKDVQIEFVEDVSPGKDCDQSFKLERIWTATDSSGNQDMHHQYVTVQDTTPPSIHGTRGLEVVVAECDDIPAFAKLTAEDNCDKDVDVTVREQRLRTSESTSTDYFLLRTYSATDDCGNGNTFISTVHVVDRTAPYTVSREPDMVVPCDAIPSAVTPVVADNCASPNSIIVELNEEKVEGECEHTYQIYRTWTITDVSGNTNSATQIVTVVDEQPPSFVETPEDSVTDQCDSVRKPFEMTAEDNCAEVEVDMVEEKVEETSENDYVLQRVWTSQDACGNTVEFTQMVTVEDTTKPKLANLPRDITVECDSVPPVSDSVTATDNCASGEQLKLVQAQRKVNFNCTNGYQELRLWVASDITGNQQYHVQTVTVQDTQAPVFTSEPADVTVNCHSVPEPAKLTVTDNCASESENTVHFHETRIAGQSPNDYLLERQWMAIDNCGNQKKHTQVVTVQDVTVPKLAGVPENTEISCEHPVPEAVVGVRDNCDKSITVAFRQTTKNGTCEDEYTVTRTWSAVDASGNTVEESQVLSYFDRTAPDFVKVHESPTITIECDEVDEHDPEEADLAITDLCDEEPTLSVESKSTQQEVGKFGKNGETPADYEIVNTWTATDRCGNSANYAQTITVEDTTAPTLPTRPKDTRVEISDVPSPAKIGADDNCDTTVVVKIQEEKTAGTCTHEYTLIRIYTATDVSGNSVEHRQTVSVQDTVSPVFSSLPVDVTVECDSVPEAEKLFATDNSGDDSLEVKYKEERIDGASPHEYVLRRTWKVADQCGNVKEHVQTVTVIDTSKPVLTGYKNNPLPKKAKVSVENVPIVYTGQVNAEDNCDGEVDVHFTERRRDGDCPHEYRLLRRWTATDGAGNMAKHTQYVKVFDDTKPVFHYAPEDIVVEWPDVPAAPQIRAEDNSEGAVSIVFNEVRQEVNKNRSPYEFNLKRTWIATDECGNSAKIHQRVLVRDTTPPALGHYPEDITVECDSIPKPCTVTAMDNNKPVQVRTAVKRLGAFKNNTRKFVYVFAARDLAGNKVVHKQTISIHDTSPPTLSRKPEDETVSCDCEDVGRPPRIFGSDNCQPRTRVHFEETRIDGANPDNYKLLRTWTSTDRTGNEVAHTQTLTVEDKDAPVLSAYPKDREESCDAQAPVATISADDNCDPEPTLAYRTERIAGNCDNNYVDIHYWTATDRTGNSAEHAQTVRVVDRDAPEFHHTEMGCIWPPTGDFLTVKLKDLVVPDNCGTAYISFISCNSTQGDISKDCFYQAGSDRLFIRASRDDDKEAGRYYFLKGEATDECGNSLPVSKTMWVPYAAHDYAVAGMSCDAPNGSEQAAEEEPPTATNPVPEARPAPLNTAVRSPAV